MKKIKSTTTKIYGIIGILILMFAVYIARNIRFIEQELSADNEFLQAYDFDFPVSVIKYSFEDTKNKVRILGKSEDSVIYCTYETIDENSNSLTAKYYRRSLNDDMEEMIAESSGSFTLLGNYIYNSGVIYAEVQQTEGLLTKIYYQNSLNNKIQLHEFEAITIPELYFNDDTLFVSYEIFNGSLIKQIIESICLKTGHVEEVVNGSYSISEDYLCTGEMLLGLSGNENGIIYQSIKFNEENPDLDYTGEAQIIYYDLAERKKEVLLEMDKKASFIGGEPQKVVITEYAYDRPLENTGKIYVKKEDKTYASYLIPEIESVNDIKACDIINDQYIIVQSYNAMYIIDVYSLKYKIYDDVEYAFFDKNMIYCMNEQQEILEIALEEE